MMVSHIYPAVHISI